MARVSFGGVRPLRRASLRDFVGIRMLRAEAKERSNDYRKTAGRGMARVGAGMAEKR